MKHVILVTAVFVFVLLTAQDCGQSRQSTPKDISKVSAVCETPYIQEESGCCLDQNNNQFCDKYESERCADDIGYCRGRCLSDEFSYGEGGCRELIPSKPFCCIPEVIIEITDMQFLPANLTVKKGTTITWINKDLFYGEATKHLIAYHSGKFYSGMLNYGDSYSFKFTEPGVYTYIDGIYKYKMKTPIGTINVTS